MGPSAARRRSFPRISSLLLAVGLLLAITTSSDAAAPTGDTAYWSQGSAAPAPGVPDGGLYVSSEPTGPTAVSGLRLRSWRATSDARLVLRVHSLHIGDAMTLVLLPSTTAWVPGDHQPWDSKPGYDQQLPPTTGVLSADQLAVSSLTSGNSPQPPSATTTSATTSACQMRANGKRRCMLRSSIVEL